MNENDLKQYIDQRVQEHIHSGGPNESQKLSFNTLRDIPDFVTNPLSTDLDLGGYKITGGTLISGQTEVDAIAVADKFLISDASDSGNLKYVEREDLGDFSTAAGSTESFSIGTSSTELIFTVLFGGTFTLSASVASGTNPSWGLTYYPIGSDLSGNGTRAKDTDGNNIEGLGSPGGSYSVYAHPGTRFKWKLDSGTAGASTLTIQYTKTLRSGAYAN